MALPNPAPTPTQPPLTQDVTEVLTDTLNSGGNLVNGFTDTWVAARDDGAETPPVLSDGIAKVVEPLQEELEDDLNDVLEEAEIHVGTPVEPELFAE
ncbi:hypothetical protein LTR15_000430 [Elasticomyces elasticus]|nr:hypothetical protein LTR15_000430 [Elasticomyces elasticus]